MRILQARFRNLNSLAGEWLVDFSHPAYSSDGIFAITGPTGAGKSTILDAVCLGLYGLTPRLDRVNQGANEIMSRQTGECFAEVTFETRHGRFRCHWSQHRAGRRPEGALQASRHELADARSGELLASRIRDVAIQVEDKTGMDFERFTRSMLLAQGGFAAFLQAAPDERAPILEKITGTDVYSDISVRVHERQREEREKLKLLQAETAGIVILEPEREQEMEQAFETRQKEETALAVGYADTKKAIDWLTTIDGLNKEIANLAEEAGKLQEDIEAFKADREKLGRASSAASLDGAYATLTATRKQQADDRADLQKQRAALPRLEASAGEQAEALRSAEQQTARAREEMKAALPALQKVRSLDQKLADQQKAIAQGDEGCTVAAKRIDADRKALVEEQEKRCKALEALDLVNGYLQEHAQDEWLLSGLGGVEEQCNDLRSRQREIAEKEAAQEAATTAVELATRSLEEGRERSGLRRQELEAASRRLQQGKDALNRLLGGRLLREYRTEKETLLREMAFLTRIAELEDHRARLEDGKPCPLCGATEHPFVKGNVPVPDETEQRVEALTRLIGKAEDQEALIRKLEEAEILARNQLTEAEKGESAAANDKKGAEQALAEVTHALGALRAGFAERRRAVFAKLQPLGVTDIPETDVSTVVDTLRARLKAWQAQVDKKAHIEKQLAAMDSEVKRLDAIIETQGHALAEKRERLETLKKEFASGRDGRAALYGDKDPDHEERRLTKAVSDAEGAERQVRHRYNELQQASTTAKARVESLQERIDQREPELTRLEAEFSAALVPAGFSDEEQFLAAKLPPESRAALTAKAKDLDERQTDLKARHKDRETRLATETARNITDQSLEALEPRFKDQEDALKDLRDIIAGLKHTLNENRAAKERIKEKQTAIEAQEQECRRWEDLHELVGSADGKKYRNFVQGLTFEMMIAHANRQLERMSDRYLLVRDDAEPLELNVIDNYQAGEVRTTKNLSGGESFIVSLALALGLSQMASRNVRVDSLFLDEGFGTLDEEALDTALETLAGLQQEGKVIGVISHVQALKERIGSRIEVIPLSGGHSALEGPGCRRLAGDSG